MLELEHDRITGCSLETFLDNQTLRPCGGTAHRPALMVKVAAKLALSLTIPSLSERKVPKHDEDSSTLRAQGVFGRYLDVVESYEGSSGCWGLQRIIIHLAIQTHQENILT
jgi:hypothetical protein